MRFPARGTYRALLPSPRLPLTTDSCCCFVDLPARTHATCLTHWSHQRTLPVRFAHFVCVAACFCTCHLPACRVVHPDGTVYFAALPPNSVLHQLFHVFLPTVILPYLRAVPQQHCHTTCLDRAFCHTTTTIICFMFAGLRHALLLVPRCHFTPFCHRMDFSHARISGSGQPAVLDFSFCPTCTLPHTHIYHIGSPAVYFEHCLYYFSCATGFCLGLAVLSQDTFEQFSPYVLCGMGWLPRRYRFS